MTNRIISINCSINVNTLCVPVCDCDSSGTSEEICNKTTGQCLCKENFMFPRCDRCAPGYYNYPTCQGQSQSYINDLGESLLKLKLLELC